MFREGWTWLYNAKKWHYFVDNRSLCGRWGLFSSVSLKQGNDNGSDNCAACKKKLIVRKKNMPKDLVDHLKSLER